MDCNADKILRVVSSDRFLTSSEVASMLSVSRRIVCRWAEDREIPAFKIGRQWRFRARQIALWISHKQRGGRTDKATPACSAHNEIQRILT
jgi:excisionase family DNA binding protein